MQYKPDVARLSTIHSPTLEPGTHDVSYHLPSNPSSPFSSRKSTFIFAFSKILSLFYSPEKTLSFHFKCLLWRIPFNISKIQSWTKMLRKMHVVCVIWKYFPLKPGSLKILPPPPPKNNVEVWPEHFYCLLNNIDQGGVGGGVTMVPNTQGGSPVCKEEQNS